MAGQIGGGPFSLPDWWAIVCRVPWPLTRAHPSDTLACYPVERGSRLFVTFLKHYLRFCNSCTSKSPVHFKVLFPSLIFWNWISLNFWNTNVAEQNLIMHPWKIDGARSSVRVMQWRGLAVASFAHGNKVNLNWTLCKKTAQIYLVFRRKSNDSTESDWFSVLTESQKSSLLFKCMWQRKGDVAVGLKAWTHHEVTLYALEANISQTNI